MILGCFIAGICGFLGSFKLFPNCFIIRADGFYPVLTGGVGALAPERFCKIAY